MIYLILALLCSASIALLFKWGQRRGACGPVITSANYLTAVCISGALVLAQGLPTGGQSAPPVLGLALWLGVATGVLYLVSFVVYQKAIAQNGASLAGMFSKLGILLPMLVSILLWREYPSAFKWVGIGLAMASIVLVNLGGGGEKSGWKLGLLLTFLFSGCAEFMTKVFQKYGKVEYENIFLLIVFAVAFVLSLGLLPRPWRKPDLKSILLGIGVGVPNLLCPYFLMKALATMPAAAVFPVYSAGSVAAILLGSYAFFGERLGRREKAAALLTLCAMVLVNL